MGCDIHCYVEYASFNRGGNGEPYWQNLGGRSNPGRDYGMFGLIAGVRGGEALFPPKGLPSGAIGWETKDDAFVRVTENGNPHDQCGCPDSYEMSRPQAEEYLAKGYAQEIERDKDGNLTRITHCDWHSHTWLTTEEFNQILEAYSDRFDSEPPAAYFALYASMLAMESRGLQVRLVCWFDN